MQDHTDQHGDARHHPGRAAQPERVGDGPVVQRSRRQDTGDHHQGRTGHAGGDDDPPTAGAQPPVREQEGRQRDAQPEGGRPGHALDHGHELSGRRHRKVAAHEMVEPYLPRDHQRPGQPSAGVQPAEGTVGAAQRDHEPDRRDGQGDEQRVEPALHEHAARHQPGQGIVRQAGDAAGDREEP